MYPVTVAMSMPPTAPAKPPMPTTEPTARRGNMSLASVKTFADHHWCDAAATPTMSTATHMLLAAGANIVGTMSVAGMSIVVLRPTFTDQPRLISAPDSQPP